MKLIQFIKYKYNNKIMDMLLSSSSDNEIVFDNVK